MKAVRTKAKRGMSLAAKKVADPKSRTPGRIALLESARRGRWAAILRPPLKPVVLPCPVSCATDVTSGWCVLEQEVARRATEPILVGTGTNRTGADKKNLSVTA